MVLRLRGLDHPWERAPSLLLIVLARAAASAGLLQIHPNRRGRCAGFGVAALALAVAACAVFFITLHVPVDWQPVPRVTR